MVPKSLDSLSRSHLLDLPGKVSVLENQIADCLSRSFVMIVVSKKRRENESNRNSRLVC